MLIFNGVVHPVDAPVIPNGYVELEGGKIKGVGPIEALPKGCEGPSLDVKGGHIVPGFVDAHCHLGLFGDALKFEGDDGNEATNPCTPHVRAIDGVNPLDRCFQEAREGGVTTVLTGPGSQNGVQRAKGDPHHPDGDRVCHSHGAGPGAGVYGPSGQGGYRGGHQCARL